jgi:hypothetical protein
MTESLHVLSFRHSSQFLIQSCKSNRLELTLLQKAHSDLQDILAFLCILPANDIVLFVNGDAVIDATQSQIIDEYKAVERSQGPCVFFSIQSKFEDQFKVRDFQCRVQCRFMSPEAWISRVGIVRDLLNVDLTEDAQLFWTKLFLTDNQRLHLDLFCKIFQNLYGADQVLDLVDGRWMNLATRHFPLIIHGSTQSELLDLKEVISSRLEPRLGHTF